MRRATWMPCASSKPGILLSLNGFFAFSAATSFLMIARIAVVVLFILFGYPKLLGFSGTVQYMASSGAPMPTLAAIIAIIMEVPAAIQKRFRTSRRLKKSLRRNR